MVTSPDPEGRIEALWESYARGARVPVFLNLTGGALNERGRGLGWGRHDREEALTMEANDGDDDDDDDDVSKRERMV
jgi:hypothetical protein